MDLTCRQGELRFLIGPNGAGKTTLVDAITGLTKATGAVALRRPGPAGRRSTGSSGSGIGRTFQTATVFEELTVLENLDLAARRPHAAAGRCCATAAGVAGLVRTALETIGLTELADARPACSRHGQKQWLEIGMLLVQHAKLLLLDEPVAGHEPRGAGARPASCCSASARSTRIVVIEHDMEFLRRLRRR